MIKMVVFDVDGTLTDGKIYTGAKGEMVKAFNVKDGLGITKLYSYGIVPVIITGRKSDILVTRSNELEIEEVYKGINDKVGELRKIAEKYKYKLSQIAYMGDDENDLDCMKVCGVSGCPADATKEVKNASDFISEKEGGNGAVREFIEYILEKNRKE
jgi:3-deoxy-D-manno-octulosonate 8-phosphate phosphatase (KDO 8-P phosphatase)